MRVKFVPKRSEKTLSSESKNLYKMVIFFIVEEWSFSRYCVDECAKGALVLRAYVVHMKSNEFYFVQT